MFVANLHLSNGFVLIQKDEHCGRYHNIIISLGCQCRVSSKNSFNEMETIRKDEEDDQEEEGSKEFEYEGSKYSI